jgi:hypothetical protein
MLGWSRESERYYTLQHLLWSRATQTLSAFLAEMPLLPNTFHVRETSSKVSFGRFQKQNSVVWWLLTQLATLTQVKAKAEEELTGIAVFCCELYRASYVSRDALLHRMNEHTGSMTQGVSCLYQVALLVFWQQNFTSFLLVLTGDGIKQSPTVSIFILVKIYFTSQIFLSYKSDNFVKIRSFV